MIIQEQGSDLILVRQTDHAVLCGFFAREWGNDTFKKIEPFDSFCLAAREHDNGWSECERAPAIDPKTRLPYSFMSLPTVEHMALYQQGIERLVMADRYAGLLASMHCAGLYDRAKATLPGFSAKYIKSDEAALTNNFLQGLRLQQLRLKIDLRAAPNGKAFADETMLQTNARRLEVLDRLSLYFCLNPERALPDAVIDGVPMNGEGSEIDLELRPEAENVISLAPYPFAREPLAISILARRVPKRPYADDADFQKTLARAPYFAIAFTLRASGTSAHTATQTANV